MKIVVQCLPKGPEVCLRIFALNMLIRGLKGNNADGPLIYYMAYTNSC